VRLTKYTHACVRLEKDGKVLVIDPGIWSEPEALDGADAVLVTHEHFDHLNSELLATLDVPVWTNAGAAAELGSLGDRVTVVEGGQAFEAGGFAIRAFGNDHAIILPELGVPCANTAYLVEDAVFHPGDSWTRPDRAVHTALVPLSGPWYSVAGAVEYVRAIAAEQATGIHDALLSDIGRRLVGNWIDAHGHKPYAPLTPGTSLDVP
jgi:L-ascorbate metabolism protein UlaG (beta-lactamase superfamily)